MAGLDIGITVEVRQLRGKLPANQILFRAWSDNDHKLDSDTATLTHNKPVGIDVKLVAVESAHREPVFSHSELVNSPVRESAATDVNTDHAEPIPRLVKPKPVVISNSAQPVCLNTAGQS